jgi:hypothetical protein
MTPTDTANSLIAWLLDGDVAIQYQVHRDLLGQERADLQARIAVEGWGRQFLAARQPAGHWGRWFYQPKWTSTHYTLLDLRHLCTAPDHAQIRESVVYVLTHHKGVDGGVNPQKTTTDSDVCVAGMALNYACYFGATPELLASVVDYILAQQLADGGFNCERDRFGARHSSLHSTISVLEGIQEYLRQGYVYRAAELVEAAAEAREFILQHRLYRSDRTGEVINPRFLLLSYPSRWFYDILRALDYFRDAGVAYDPRMQDALDVLKAKRRKDGAWPLQAKHPGQVHFDMETPGQASRWNTLRALRVLQHFERNG